MLRPGADRLRFKLQNIQLRPCFLSTVYKIFKFPHSVMICDYQGDKITPPPKQNPDLKHW